MNYIEIIFFLRDCKMLEAGASTESSLFRVSKINPGTEELTHLFELI